MSLYRWASGPSGPREQAQWKQRPSQNPILNQMRLMSEVHSKHLVNIGQSGRQIRCKNQAVFVARARWMPFSRDSRKGLYCKELDVYTYLTQRVLRPQNHNRSKILTDPSEELGWTVTVNIGMSSFVILGPIYAQQRGS